MDERADTIERELAALVAEVGRRRYGKRAWTGSVHVALELDADAAGEWRLTGPGVLEVVEGALREAAARESTFQPSRMYCHRCETPSCAHAVPSRPTEVFAGVGPTGMPEWADLGQVLLACRHGDVDALYERPPRLLTLVEAGRDLKARQLAAFGRRSKSYDVLQQVVAGYYRLRRPGAARGEEERVALSCQAVEHRGPAGEVRLDLNVLGRAPGGADAVPLLLENLGERLAAPLRNARDGLHELQEQLKDPGLARDRKGRSRVLGRVPAIMRKLARDLTSGARRRERRTGHAEHRRRQSRPVQSAVRESLKSTPERTYVDEREGTLVVRGRRNRVHVFTRDGRLVTSLTMEDAAVERRVRQERWRPASREEVAGLRRVLARQDP